MVSRCCDEQGGGLQVASALTITLGSSKLNMSALRTKYGSQELLPHFHGVSFAWNQKQTVSLKKIGGINAIQASTESSSFRLAVFGGNCHVGCGSTTSGSLSGTVQDAKGAAITGATVEVTGASRKRNTNHPNRRRRALCFSQLQPDSYTLRVQVHGFKGYELEGLVLGPNDKISAPDIELQVALSRKVC